MHNPKRQILLPPTGTRDQVPIRCKYATPPLLEPRPIITGEPGIGAILLHGFAQIGQGVDEGLTHVDFGDGAVGAEDDVEGGLGVGDVDGDGVAARGRG